MRSGVVRTPPGTIQFEGDSDEAAGFQFAPSAQFRSSPTLGAGPLPPRFDHREGPTMRPISRRPLPSSLLLIAWTTVNGKPFRVPGESPMIRVKLDGSAAGADPEESR
jgi:hypothetical protein